MNPFEGTLVVGGLFILRFAIPVLLTIAFGYAMNRVMERQ